MNEKKIPGFDIRFDEESPDEVWREKPAPKQDMPKGDGHEIHRLKRRVAINALLIPLFCLVLAAGVYLLLDSRISHLTVSSDSRSQADALIQQQIASLAETQSFLKEDLAQALRLADQAAGTMESSIKPIEKQLAALKKSAAGGLSEKDVEKSIKKALSPLEKKADMIEDLSKELKSLQSGIKDLKSADNKDLDKKLTEFQNRIKKMEEGVASLQGEMERLGLEIRRMGLAINVMKKEKVSREALDRALEKQKNELLDRRNPPTSPSSSGLPEGGVTEQPIN